MKFKKSEKLIQFLFLSFAFIILFPLTVSAAFRGGTVISSIVGISGMPMIGFYLALSIKVLSDKRRLSNRLSLHWSYAAALSAIVILHVYALLLIYSTGTLGREIGLYFNWDASINNLKFFFARLDLMHAYNIILTPIVYAPLVALTIILGIYSIVIAKRSPVRHGTQQPLPECDSN